MPQARSGKPLLVFAHRGEAKGFLSRGTFQPVKWMDGALFESGREFLLITGEGIVAALAKLAAAGGFLAGRLSRVINLGIAGALDDRSAVGSIVSIRTVYGEDAAGPISQSFVTADELAQIDCISARERVLEADYARRLSYFAGVVDRELWGIAHACEMLGLPLYSYKLISDRAGAGGDSRDCRDCRFIRSQADRLSAELLEFYETCHAAVNHLPEKGKGAEKRAKQPTPTAELLPAGFYATASQLRQLEELLGILQIKFGCSTADVLKRADLREIENSEPAAKRRTAKLIEQLKALADPFHARLQRRVEELSAPVTEAGWQVRFSPDFEDAAIGISAIIVSASQLCRLRAALDVFDYPAAAALLDGEPQSVAAGDHEI